MSGQPTVIGGFGLGDGAAADGVFDARAVQLAVEHEVDLRARRGHHRRDRRVGVPAPDQPGSAAVDLPQSPTSGSASRAAPRPPSGSRARRAWRRPAGSAARASSLFLSRVVSPHAVPRGAGCRYHPARMSLPAIEIRDADDPRLADYRRLKERHLNAEGGRFVAESERVVRRLVASGLGVHSVLLTPPRLATLSDALGRPVPGVRRGAAGARRHRRLSRPPRLSRDRRAPAVRRRCRAARARWSWPRTSPTSTTWGRWRATPPRSARTRWCSPRAAPIRSTARRSASRSGRCSACPSSARARGPAISRRCAATGSEIIGAVVEPGATPLAHFRPPARFALLLGAEGPGLSAAARACCDHLVTIPMSAGADSLNVATAGAIFLYALAQGHPPPAHR